MARFYQEHGTREEVNFRCLAEILSEKNATLPHYAKILYIKSIAKILPSFINQKSNTPFTKYF